LQKCCFCCKETSCVPSEVLVVTFTLLLIDTMKWPRRILDSLFDLTAFLKNHQHTLSLNEVIVFIQQQQQEQQQQHMVGLNGKQELDLNIAINHT